MERKSDCALEHKRIERVLTEAKKLSEDNFVLLLKHIIEIEAIIDFIIQRNREQIKLQNEIEAEIKRIHEKENLDFKQGYEAYLQREEAFHRAEIQKLMEALQEKIHGMTGQLDTLFLLLDEKIKKLDTEIALLDRVYQQYADCIEIRVNDIVNNLLPITAEFKQGDELRAHMRDTVKAVLEQLRHPHKTPKDQPRVEPKNLEKNILDAMTKSVDSFLDKMNITDPQRQQKQAEVSKEINACKQAFVKEFAADKPYLAKMQVVAETREKCDKLRTTLQKEKEQIQQASDKLEAIKESSAARPLTTSETSALDELAKNLTKTTNATGDQRDEFELLLKQMEALQQVDTAGVTVSKHAQ